jgi:HAD superfamily hydrolase (TIGR01509 family)
MPGLVLFDLDNTLADRVTAFDRWARSFVQENGIDTNALDWLLHADADGFRPREDFLGEVRARFDLDDDTCSLVARYHEKYPLCYRPEPKSLAAVAELQQAGFKVGIVTNGAPSQETKLRETGLAAVVDAVCVSSLVGSRKPDRAIFEEAARRCDRPLVGWMVGDDPVADIQGGHRAGLRTVWLRRRRRWDLPELLPDYSVDTLGEVVKTILNTSQ